MNPTEVTDALDAGDLHVLGRIAPASNATYFAEIRTGEQPLQCVYKPIDGEKPLWDFPGAVLAHRERAAYVVSQALGWDVVPATVLREGPLGLGMVQLWCEPCEDVAAVDLVARGEVPPGFLHVLDAYDHRNRAISLIHEDHPALRRMALFDIVINNADRKGGHVLATDDGRRLGVDHGIGFHEEDKLRTVLWGFVGQPLSASEREDLDRLRGDLGHIAELADLLSAREVKALKARLGRLLRRPVFPAPTGEWPAIPWPAF